MSIRQQYIDALRAGREAAQTVVDNWSSGSLAFAVNNLEEWIEEADELLADWDKDDKGEEGDTKEDKEDENDEEDVTMSNDFKVIHRSATVIELGTPERRIANPEIYNEISNEMWPNEEKGNGDYVLWNEEAESYPHLAKYIADNKLSGDILIYYSW